MPALFDYRHVGVQKGVAYGLGHGKAGLEASLVDIVEEQTAYAPGFVALFQVEILVAPFFMAGVFCAAAGGQGVLHIWLKLWGTPLEKLERIMSIAAPTHPSAPSPSGAHCTDRR